MTTPAPAQTVDHSQRPTVGLLGILRILIKWSFVVAPLAALTIWLALSMSADIKPEYTAEASVQLIGTSEIQREDPVTGEIFIESINPLESSPAALTLLARVTVLALGDASVGQELVDSGLTANYNIWVDGRSPIIRTSATDEDPAIAAATAERMINLVFSTIEERQDDVDAPEINRITALPISSGLVGGADFGARDRFRLAIAAVGFALSAAAAFFLEGITELWRRHKRRNAAHVAPEPPRAALPSGEPPVDRLVSGRPSTIADLAATERNSLASVLHLQTGNQEVAEAITAEAFAAATAEWDRLRHGEPVEWLYGHAIHQAWAQPEGSFPTEHGGDNVLWNAVHDLSQETRAVVALAYLAEFTNQRIAGTLSMTVRQVEKHRELAADRLAVLSADPSFEGELRASKRAAAPIKSQKGKSGEPKGDRAKTTRQNNKKTSRQNKPSKPSSNNGGGQKSQQRGESKSNANGKSRSNANRQRKSSRPSAKR